MTANDSSSYLPYLYKLIDQYNNTYHYSINKKLINSEIIEINPKAPKFKVNDRVRITTFTLSLIRDKVKVVLDLSNCATKEELDHATVVDTSNLAAKKDLIALKAEVDKLDINKQTNVPTSLINLKTNDLDWKLFR